VCRGAQTGHLRGRIGPTFVVACARAHIGKWLSPELAFRLQCHAGAVLAFEPLVAYRAGDDDVAERQMTTEHEPAAEPEPLRVLLVDNDRDVTELVTAILSDEGFEVSTVDDTSHESIAAAVGRDEPDCVILDSADGPAYGGSWKEAAYLATRRRAIPSVMFTSHAEAVHEAREGTSDRAKAAGFAAIVPKPFALDELVAAVTTATGRSERFDRSDTAEHARTSRLAERLRAVGAADIRTSDRREWATFVSPRDGRIYQIYWWQRLGLYIVGRYDDADARLEMVGQFYELDAAMSAAVDRGDEAPRG
jgi:DNA-binding response OmpR family regulator